MEPAKLFENADPLIAEYDQLEVQLTNPATHADPVLIRRVGRRYTALHPVVEALALYRGLAANREVALELAEQDPAFAEEVGALEAQLEETTARLTRLLAPRNPDDDANVILEIKSGKGGEESALSAADLLRMYQRYAGQVGRHLEVLDSQATDLGGFESVTAAVEGTGVNGVGPYGRLKFEGGMHRVQHVPVTETQGRIHTSAADVLVFPDIEPEELEINESDLRIDVFRVSGPGGQGMNTTDSAVRIAHLPTRVVVSCQNERSQLQNREQVVRLLRSRLAAIREAKVAEAASTARRSQVRMVDRSKRIRTYSFPEDRFVDHRIGFKAHNLDLILAGALAPVLDALAETDLAERLSGPGR